MNSQELAYSIKSLTPKEKSIVELIVLGNSTKQIAEKLFNSKRTIDTHRQNIAVKFNRCGQGRLFLFLIENKSRILKMLAPTTPPAFINNINQSQYDSFSY